jgi:hypothetical protein
LIELYGETQKKKKPFKIKGFKVHGLNGIQEVVGSIPISSTRLRPKLRLGTPDSFQIFIEAESVASVAVSKGGQPILIKYFDPLRSRDSAARATS